MQSGYRWAFVALICIIQSCRDQDGPLPPDPCDASRIEGIWHDASQSPYWYYEFNEPHLRQWVEVGGTVVTEQHYLYATSADTLWASGPGGERLWLLCFPTDSTAVYREWNIIKWSPESILKRVQ